MLYNIIAANLFNDCSNVKKHTIPVPHAVGPLHFSTCNIETGQREATNNIKFLLSSPACAANTMQRAEGFVL